MRLNSEYHPFRSFHIQQYSDHLRSPMHLSRPNGFLRIEKSSAGKTLRVDPYSKKTPRGLSTGPSEITSFAAALLSCHRDTRAVHEDDFPDARSLLEEGRFQPILLHGAGAICDASLIDVSNPCCSPRMWTSGSVTFHSYCLLASCCVLRKAMMVSPLNRAPPS